MRGYPTGTIVDCDRMAEEELLPVFDLREALMSTVEALEDAILELEGQGYDEIDLRVFRAMALQARHALKAQGVA
jgi:hypothetical protein